jgi:integrase
LDGAVLEQDLVGLTPHGLRHTAASITINSGATVLTVQRMLGHAKPSITLDVYADLFDDDLDVVAGRMHTARTEAVADYLRTIGQNGPLRVVS